MDSRLRGNDDGWNERSRFLRVNTIMIVASAQISVFFAIAYLQTIAIPLAGAGRSTNQIWMLSVPHAVA